MADAKRTDSGEPSVEDRKKYAVLDDGRFPIWDKDSAIAALKLRGRGTTKVERKKIVDAAAKFAPAEAKQARMDDINA